MSATYIFECAKNFEELYSRMNERLEIFKSQANKQEELARMKTTLSEMENILNTIELENSLMANQSGITNENNIAKTCRSHYNDIRRRFAKLENGRLTRVL